MSTKTPATFVISPENHGGVVVIVSTLLMTWSILCFFIRVYALQNGSGVFRAADYLCLGATLIGVIETIVGCVAVGKGFGKAQALISNRNLITVQKYTYTVVLLCIVALYLSKLSIVFFHVRITPRKDHCKIAYGLLGCIGVVGVASFIVEAARCGGAAPWSLIDRQCSNYNASWEAVAALDMMLEILIFAMPVYILWDLQMAVRNKLVILTAFALRLPIIIMSAVHLYYIRQWTGSARPLLATVTPFVVLQIETHYATMSSTFPCLGPFMKNLNTRMGTMGTEQATLYALESMNDKSGSNVSRKGTRANGNETVVSGNETGRTFRMQKSDRDHPRSQTRSRSSDDSREMIIHKITDTTVVYDS